MADTPVTFIDIFGSEHTITVEGKEKTVTLNRIVIPIIQRDYAQGRESVIRIRRRFLEALKDALVKAPITLDFIYGDINAKGEMTPLDGQQRLTTLFLLHYYAAKKEQIAAEECCFLENFSYETRYSAREFCRHLVSFEPSFTKKLSAEIEDQPWFPLDWKKDATVHGMLVMLDAIQKTFADVMDIWGKLKSGAITFYFDTLNDLGLTDEIYIKMNSRGKPLTQFEHFKAELERSLREYDEDRAKAIISKIDREWTDLLWTYRGNDNVIDDEFLRYFHFITDIISYRQGGTTQSEKLDDFEVIEQYFSRKCQDIEENLTMLESCFDCWYQVSRKQPISDFMSSYLASRHEQGKIIIDEHSNANTDVFEECLRSYGDMSGKRRTFTLGRIIILYAFVVFLNNRDTVTDQQFRVRLRTVNNLVQNSEDEISDSENRSAGNRMPNILRQVDSIILTGSIDTEFTKKNKNFNEYQMQEEIQKAAWLSANPDKAGDLFTLEDHHLLHGQIAVVGLDHADHFEKFVQLFSCSWDYVDRALMATGDYKQLERGGWRHQVGSSKMDSAWIELFHKSSNQGFNSTKNVLSNLFDRLDSIDDSSLKEYYEAYLRDCEEKSLFEWRYYYVKYDSFRLGRFGKCSWKDFKKGFYNMHILFTQYHWSENSYHPFLAEAARNLIYRDSLGEYLSIGENLLACENDAIVMYHKGDMKEIERRKIAQNEDGIDIEDRISVIKEYVHKLLK